MLKLGLLLVCCLTATACTHLRQENMRENFEKSVKEYNRMLRWQEVESAGMTYLEPGQREAFGNAARQMRKRGVSIADYRVLSSECLPEKDSASVVVEFDYYILPSARLKTLTYQQNWVYWEADDQKGWRLKSPLPEFE
jgi:hypothetical protein